MLKSNLIHKLNQKYSSLSLSDTEKILSLFFNKILNGLNNNQNFEDILIYFTNEEDNLIYAKSGKIIDEDNNLVFTLFNGFKITVNNEEIEKLKFENYRIEFPNIKKKCIQKF